MFTFGWKHSDILGGYWQEWFLSVGLVRVEGHFFCAAQRQFFHEFSQFFFVRALIGRDPAYYVQAAASLTVAGIAICSGIQ